ncbi:DegT/DnrJ/EryC1/StrS family aminotransferase [Polynucleobacter sp. AP-Ainpum-60-G11]|nr:DegT/DnrJ/EryC1/StrS family aminotransferase [Polynucleobacter sp. AP-Ainpum-60-G11]
MNLIRLSKSSVGNEEIRAVTQVLREGYLGMGEQVKQFEINLEKFFGRKVLCVSTGTSALQLALQACGIGSGDEVIVPSLTYIASFQAISATGAKPVACDVDASSLIIDSNDVEKRITKKTRAIMPVHYSGGVGELEKIYSIAKKYKLRVIEDAAHAFGTIHKNQLVGSFGDIVCFSFDGIKNITSGEGGCVVSNDKKLMKVIEDLRLLGVENDSANRYKNIRSWSFDVKHLGWRYHMSNIMASIGMVQLKKFEKLSQKRQALAKRYDDKLRGIGNVLPLSRDYDFVVPHIYVIILSKKINRSLLMTCLLKLGIQTGIHYYPNHLLTLFKSAYKLKNTEDIHQRILTLPLHPEMKLKDIDYICSQLESIVRN